MILLCIPMSYHREIIIFEFSKKRVTDFNYNDCNIIDNSKGIESLKYIIHIFITFHKS
jgi:hypothetical protein